MNIDWSKMQTAEALAAERSLLGYRSWKSEREEKVRAIVVEVDGLRFDGDEDSQNRMARAVPGRQHRGQGDGTATQNRLPLGWRRTDPHLERMPPGLTLR